MYNKHYMLKDKLMDIEQRTTVTKTTYKKLTIGCNRAGRDMEIERHK